MAERQYVNLSTPFGEKVEALVRAGRADEVLAEYPRPQLVRDSYLCLNGLWEYAILSKNESLSEYQGTILVPFSPETKLSGVEKIVKPDDVLYYKRTFVVDGDFIRDRVLLHFGAVDYRCTVKINGSGVGEHKGGFFPFCLDVTKFIKSGENVIEVSVTDPSDTGVQAKGKQKLNASGIWYTPQSGIWQTVWLESVANTYIKSLKLVPDIDAGTITIEADCSVAQAVGTVRVMDGEKEIANAPFDGKAVLPIADAKLWSPESPFLYDLEVDIGSDNVKSYFGMRKFSIMNDEAGIPRLALNNKPYFHNGLLDQGYWSDSMLTPPSEEAIIYDIATMKAMGFNMLRKHIKLEPLRWYYHCDKLGMLVWQDMVSGGGKYKFSVIGALPFIGCKLNDHNYKRFGREDEAGRAEYYEDLKCTVNALYNCVSIALWVPFNEAWGQFDAVKAERMLREMDPTRLIDHASGWHDQGGGDFRSLHIYFKPVKVPKDKRPVVLSEFGGYSYKSENHVFNCVKDFGYRKFANKEELQTALQGLFDKQIIPNIAKGLAATVYTQVSDVEDEINGLLTYDRKVEKVDRAFMKAICDRLKY